MTSNNFTTRFVVGKTYRLHTSPSLPEFRGGTFTVKAELTPRNNWGSRTLLVDAVLHPKGDTLGTETRLGIRCYVEEGYAELRTSYGSRLLPVEIATLQGIYPYRAKGYANDETHRGGFTSVMATRTVA